MACSGVMQGLFGRLTLRAGPWLGMLLHWLGLIASRRHWHLQFNDFTRRPHTQEDTELLLPDGLFDVLKINLGAYASALTVF